MSDPWILTSALFSLICALLSTLFGCLYIIRFSTMKKMHKAAQWAYESQKTNIVWNVWVMLAMPAFWLVWSIILFIIGIMSFVWRGTAHAREDMRITEKDALMIRIGTTILLSIGIFYFLAMARTFARYGSKEWQEEVVRWSEKDDVDEAQEEVEASVTASASLPPSPDANHLEEKVPEPGLAPNPMVPPIQRLAASLPTADKELLLTSSAHGPNPVKPTKAEDVVNSFWDAEHQWMELLGKRVDDSSMIVERLITFFDER
jgi:hypothetical protein